MSSNRAKRVLGCLPFTNAHSIHILYCYNSVFLAHSPLSYLVSLHSVTSFTFGLSVIHQLSIRIYILLGRSDYLSYIHSEVQFPQLSASLAHWRHLANRARAFFPFVNPIRQRRRPGGVLWPVRCRGNGMRGFTRGLRWALDIDSGSLLRSPRQLEAGSPVLPFFPVFVSRSTEALQFTASRGLPTDSQNHNPNPNPNPKPFA